MLDQDADWVNDDPNWEDEQSFELADIDLQAMTSMGGGPSEDLTVEEDPIRFRQYLARKQ